MRAARGDALRRAYDAGIRGLLLAGVDCADWYAQADLIAAQTASAARSPSAHIDIACAYGLHPQEIDRHSDAELAQQLDALSAALSGTAATLPRPHAVGELGLDARTPERRASLPRQERVFRAQLALARQQDLPIVLHILRTHGDALRVLRTDGVPRCGGVVHSFSGSADLVRDYVALGLSVSFSGSVTLPQAHHLHDAARIVPSDRLLIETDAPDQTPMSHRPSENEPAFLPAVCASVATLRGIDPTLLAQITEENARRLFRVPAARPHDPRSAAIALASDPTQPRRTS